MNIRPLNKRIVAKLIEEEEEKRGIILTLKEPRRDVYIVLSVASNEQGIKEGDKILIDKYAAIEKEVNGDRVYIIHCDQVVGIIE